MMASKMTTLVSGGATTASIVTLVCSYCGKVFSGNKSVSGVRSNYNRHLLTHTHERPYTCSYCGAGFTTNPNKRRHIRSFHPEMASPTLQPSHPKHGEASCDPAPEAPSLVPSTRASSGDEKGLQLPASATVSRDSSADELRCRHCGKRFIWRTALTWHEARCKRGGDNRRRMGLPRGAPSSSLEPSAPPRIDVLTCPDCEQDVSSRAALRRHRRYTCPFREDVFADLLDGEESDSTAERAAGTRWAATMGLRFYENANESGSEGGMGSTGDSDSDVTASVDSRESDGREDSVGGTRDVEEDDVDSDGPTILEQLHLDFKRRHGRQRRPRRILLRRLRCKEVADSEGSALHTRNDCLPLGSLGEDMRPHRLVQKQSDRLDMAPTEGRGLISAHSDQHPEGGSLTGSGILAETMRRRAEALVKAGYKRQRAECCVCPFAMCGRSFSTRRLLMTHAARCHPEEYARHRGAAVGHAAEEL